ncbi:hypothetical protein NXV86_01915 [Bacteroides sp. BFG-257]|uniref:hypothetical protein n=1 Tax=Bacteroides sp. BFG-257 TaxID=2972761 RepID=UPI002162E691|nr:hypothetical protein [Bacteroides sp. BFG-257]UVO98828.1 hypothetical protein NXV86_01915 [Bacteroides sp. BFG-257]
MAAVSLLPVRTKGICTATALPVAVFAVAFIVSPVTSPRTYTDGRGCAFQPGFDAGDAFGVASGDGEFELHPAEKLAHGQADAHGVVGYDGGDGGAAEKHSGVGALQAAAGGGTGYGGGAVGDAYAVGEVVGQ